MPCGRLSWLLVRFWAHVNIVVGIGTTELRITHQLLVHSSVYAWLLRIMDVGLRKVHCVCRMLPLSAFRVCSINYNLACSPRFTKYALCVVYLARFLCHWRRKNLMTFEIQVLGGSWLLKVTPVNSSHVITHYLLVINYTRCRILYRLWGIAFDR